MNFFGMRFHVFFSALENFLFKHGLSVVLLFALVYYALYCNAHLTLTGEAGSNVLIAHRILEGWRPIKDMFIGYNLMWFYPLAWIFEFTGPHLLASRIYFMVLCLLSGLMGFCVVRKTTGSGILASAAGVLMILMPGAMYRNSVPFVATLAAFALVYGYVIQHSSRLFQILWMGFTGAAMSLCFLIRIEPSLLASVIWVGLVVLYPIGFPGEFVSRLKTVLAGTFLGVCAFAVVHAPFVHHAYQRGFGPEFTGQYFHFVNLLRWELQKEMNVSSAPKKDASLAPVPSLENAKPVVPALSETVKSAVAEPSDGRRQRPPLADSIMNGRVSFFPLSLYFPVLVSAMLAALGGLFFLSGVISGSAGIRESGLAILTTTGCALSLFSQFFFFRPDSVHLAEFMVPFYPALACAAAVGIGLIRRGGWIVAWCGGLIVLLIGLQVFVAINALFGREGSGSIRIARGKSALFEAAGGVRFRVKPNEIGDWQNLRDTLVASTRDGDFLVTYPYVPLLNLIAERPSYQTKLYVDNATESPDFPEKTVSELREKQPAVVVLNNRDINNTEISRFKNWAAPVHDFLFQNYVLAGTYFENIEVFVRPDRAPGERGED
jgi:hypothetical protein